MAIGIRFDLVGNPEPPTIILANRNGNKLGQLNVETDSIEINDKFNDASEFSFTVHKNNEKFIAYDNPQSSTKHYLLEDDNNSDCFLEEDDETYLLERKYVNNANLWDKIVDFKLVYCKEWDMWFEIKVELDEDNETIKTVFCTQLGQAELSQINLYDVEINTEKDIERDDYKISILYDPDNPEASTLHRMLEKAPHYSIAYVSPTIAKIQRSFSFDGSSIYDALQEVAEEVGCLFIFPSNSDENGRIQRKIYVYDLQQYCNDCGHRGEFLNMCPKCGSTNITKGYGEDTLIFVTSDELASSNIKLVTDVDAVKNCFKLEAGDDLMTATVRNCNPNGTDYMWYFSEDLKEDMSDELVVKLESYNLLHKHYYNDYIADIDTELLEKYNALVDKYIVYNKDLQRIEVPVVGYAHLMNACYNNIDLALYLKSVLMPSVEISDTNAEEQAKLLTTSSLSPVSVANIKTASLATMNSAVLAVAKIVVKSTYKVQISTSELIEDGDNKYWNGNFIITNYSDEEDTVISDIVSVEVNGDLETFIKQKIEKALNKENTDDLSISGLFAKEHDEFCAELTKYALNPLISFRDACQACIDILIEQGVTNGSTWSDTSEGSSGNLYENLYEPYYNKLKAIEAEIKIREDEISIISGVYDVDGNLISDGLQTNIEKCRTQIQNALNFENYLGSELWLEFCAYRREDKYSNDNYISDGLNNAELFKKALEFYEVAENEIYKSAELQHSISTTLNNLLAIPKFKKLVKSFNVGNWIRVQIDNKIYKLRLLEYGVDFGDFDNISVEFSDVTKVKNGINDVKSILSQASSMATSYNSTKRQASQGAKGSSVLNNWVEDGLNATQTKIVDSYDENLMFGKNAFWCRQYDPITDTYSDEQIKIVNSTIAITDDNWATTKTAVGKYYYVDKNTGELKSAYGINGETIVGRLFLGEYMSMQNESGNMIFDGNGMTITSVTDDGVGTMTFNENGLIVNHGDNTVTISPKSEEVMNITNGNDKVFEVNENGELSINGNIIARSLKLENGVTIDSGVITDLADVATSASYDDLIDTPTKLSDFENDGVFITKDANNLTNYYKKTETDNLLNQNYYKKNEVDVLLGSKVNSEDLAEIATSGSYNDLKDIEEFKKWILEQIESAVG
jgi:hypothetical protein